MESTKLQASRWLNGMIYDGYITPRTQNTEFFHCFSEMNQSLNQSGLNFQEIKARLQVLNRMFVERQQQFQDVQDGKRQRITLDRKLFKAELELKSLLKCQVIYSTTRNRYEVKW